MSHVIIIVIFSLVLLVVLVSWLKMDAFLAFLLVSICAGIALGAGSIFFSHVNDSGFWLFKEYFNLSLKDTIRSWSVMEAIVSVAGLAGVLILNIFL